MARSRRKRKRWEEGIILLATHAHDVLSPPPLVVQSLLLWMMDRTQFPRCIRYSMTHTQSNKSTMEAITIHKIMLGETSKAATVLDPSPKQPPKRAPKKSPNENLQKFSRDPRAARLSCAPRRSSRAPWFPHRGLPSGIPCAPLGEERGGEKRRRRRRRIAHTAASC